MSPSRSSTSGLPTSPAWTMRCDPRRAATASGRRRPWVSEITPTLMGHGRSRDLSVGDELEQRAIGIAEVDAHPIAARTCALDRSELGGYAMCVQMCLSLRDRSGPLETQIAVSRRNGAPRHRRGIESGPVTVELQVAKSIDPTIAPRYDLGAHHIPIERVRPRPVRDMDDAVIELERGHGYLPPVRHPHTSANLRNQKPQCMRATRRGSILSVGML